MSTSQLLKDFQIKKTLFEAYRDKINSLLKDLLYVSSVTPHQITCRVKDERSLSDKIERKKDKYNNLIEITDLIGIRIITYFEDDVDKIASIIEKEFEIDELNSIDKRILDADKFGYRSLHYVISLSKARLGLTENKIYAGLKAEIQIRSILQHAWAEIEHDIGYKGETQIPDFARRGFYRVAALLETADIEFVKLKDSLNKYEIEVTEKIKTKPENVRLDKASLTKYALSSSIVKEIEKDIQSLTKAKEVKEMPDFINMYLDRLSYFKIGTIKDLNNLLEIYRTQIPKFAYAILGTDKEAIPVGLSIFYLAYILACKDEDFEKTLTFCKNIFTDHEQPEIFTKKLIQAYETTKISS